MENVQYMLATYTKYLNTPREILSANIKKIYKQHGIKFHNQRTAEILNKEYLTVASYFKTDGNKVLFEDLLTIAITLDEPIENFMIA